MNPSMANVTHLFQNSITSKDRGLLVLLHEGAMEVLELVNVRLDT